MDELPVCCYIKPAKSPNVQNEIKLFLMRKILAIAINGSVMIPRDEIHLILIKLNEILMNLLNKILMKVFNFILMKLFLLILIKLFTLILMKLLSAILIKTTY